MTTTDGSLTDTNSEVSEHIPSSTGVTDGSDGSDTLNRVAEVLDAYVSLPSTEARDAITLWIAATHATEAFEHATRLAITSPVKRCGKTRLLDIITALSHDPLKAGNASVAAIFRLIGSNPKTLVIDEADSLFGHRKVAESNEDLRRLINVGFKRGEPVIRCDGPNNEPREFPTFAMVVIAGIGELPDTITDRAVNVLMRRRAPNEAVQMFRERHDGKQLEGVRDQLANWVTSQLATLANTFPHLPVEDRAADTWEPLVAIADVAGGDWPDRARRACRVLAARAVEDDNDNGNMRLLSDLNAMLTATRDQLITTKAILNHLNEIEGSPWSERQLTSRGLASRLKGFGVKPMSTGRVRGYPRRDLFDAIARYVPVDPSEPSDPSVTPLDLEQPTDRYETPPVNEPSATSDSPHPNVTVGRPCRTEYCDGTAYSRGLCPACLALESTDDALMKGVRERTASTMEVRGKTSESVGSIDK